MTKIFNSVDCLFITKNKEIILIKRDIDPYKNKLALVGGVQNDFETFESTIERILKQKLGLISQIEDGIISFNEKSYPLIQTKSYDSGSDTRGGNTTVFVINTDLEINDFKKFTSKIFYTYHVNELPELAFDHKDFIRDYFFHEKHYTPSLKQSIGVTVDIVLLTIENGILKILLAKRSKDPFKDHYAIPGGFIDEKKSLDKNAKEILKRDTNIDNAYLEQLYSFGDVQRDSRGRIITIAYYALINSDILDLEFSPKYNAINWLNLSQLKKENIAFDHKDIINAAINRIKNKIEYTNIAFQLLPKKFTLAELQEVYETILEKPLDKRNFRKKINDMDMLEELDEFKKQGRMRPARYYTFKESKEESIMKVKKWI